MEKSPTIAVECDGASSMFTEIEAGRGLAILPRVFQKIVGARLKLRPLLPPPLPQEVGIVRSLTGDVTPAGEKFCSELRRAAARLSKE
jgi:DNA-binding transcriptional LysR family regulator